MGVLAFEVVTYPGLEERLLEDRFQGLTLRLEETLSAEAQTGGLDVKNYAEESRQNSGGCNLVLVRIWFHLREPHGSCKSQPSLCVKRKRLFVRIHESLVSKLGLFFIFLQSLPKRVSHIETSRPFRGSRDIPERSEHMPIFRHLHLGLFSHLDREDWKLRHASRAISTTPAVV